MRCTQHRQLKRQLLPWYAAVPGSLLTLGVCIHSKSVNMQRKQRQVPWQIECQLPETGCNHVTA